MDYAFGEGSESSLLPSKSHGSIPNQNSAARYIIGGITVVALILAGSLLGRTSTRTPADNSCQAPSYRQEWRMLSLEERQAYITAVQCLTTKPSRMEHNGTTRYDDFVYSHLAVSAETHGTPISFPWHRIYIQKYEDALRLECGYQGNLPYWDWTLDASTNPLHSPIWSHEFGLGGNGSHPANCVEDGPFAAIKPQYPEPHCLQRKFSDENMYGREYTASIVNAIVTESNSYGEFRERLEAGPHRFIHLAIGGDMPELWSSNDPVFFLHHAQIDRLWWQWQLRGRGGLLRGYQEVVDVTTLLRYSGLGRDMTAGEVISTQSDLLCYGY